MSNFQSKMQDLAMGQVVAKAAKDYQKEMGQNKPTNNENFDANQELDDLDLDSDEEDDEIRQLQEQRIKQLLTQQQQARNEQEYGLGSYEEIQEQEFLEVTTKVKRVVCHFYHRDFKRCQVVDEHLSKLANKHRNTKFTKISAPDAPFFVAKLSIQVLPCILLFKNGLAIDRIVGFTDFDDDDEFTTAELERRIGRSKIFKQEEGVLEQNKYQIDQASVRKGGAHSGGDDFD